MIISIRVTVFLLQLYRLRKKPDHRSQERLCPHIIPQTKIVQFLQFSYKLEAHKTTIDTPEISHV